MKESVAERQMNLFSASRQDAQALLNRRLEVDKGRTNDLLLKVLDTIIEDKFVAHDDVYISPREEAGFNIFFNEGMDARYLHRNAIVQICGRTRVPLSYVDFLIAQGEWGRVLAADNMQTVLRETAFKKQENRSRRFLLRSVNNEARAFLSRRYGIHLSTSPLLFRFLEYCKSMKAVPADGNADDLRVSIKCVLPYVYEAIPGTFIAVGLHFHNSDFGVGKFSLRESIWDAAHQRGIILGEPEGSLIDKELKDRVHLGPLLQEADLSPVHSARADKTEAVAQSMKKTIEGLFSHDWITSLCLTILHTSELEIPFESINRGAILLKEEVEVLKKLLVDRHPFMPGGLRVDADGLPIPTRWWAASALSELAARQTETARKLELQEEAGKFLKE